MKKRIFSIIKERVIPIIIWIIVTFIGFFLGNALFSYLFHIKTSQPTVERFITYHLDKTISYDFITNGVYYVVDTETDNVYLRMVGGSNIGLSPLYDENGNITKAKDMGIIY